MLVFVFIIINTNFFFGKRTYFFLFEIKKTDWTLIWSPIQFVFWIGPLMTKTQQLVVERVWETSCSRSTELNCPENGGGVNVGRHTQWVSRPGFLSFFLLFIWIFSDAISAEFTVATAATATGNCVAAEQISTPRRDSTIGR